MSHVVTVPELLDGHTVLDIECLDRVYVNGYVPVLQVGGQVFTFLHDHRGMPIASPAAGLDDVLEELREIARGLHPAILADGGLRPALKTLARRSAVPVHLDIQVDRRLPEPVEIAAYYTVSEALTNTAKHAWATTADIHVTETDRLLHVRVRDDGRGGADFGNGSGLVGLKDRAEALGGHLQVHSPPGAGTTLEIELPLRDPSAPPLPPEAADPGQRFDQPEAAQRAAHGPSAPDRDVRPPG